MSKHDKLPSKWRQRWHGPFEIVTKLSDSLYRIAPVNDDGSLGVAWKANVAHIAPCPGWQKDDPSLRGLDLRDISGPNDLILDRGVTPWDSADERKNIHKRPIYKKRHIRSKASTALWDSVAGLAKGQVLAVRDRLQRSGLRWRLARVFGTPPASGLFVNCHLYSVSRGSSHRRPEDWEWLKVYLDPENGTEIGYSHQPGSGLIPLTMEVPAVDIITEVNRLHGKKLEAHTLQFLKKDGWLTPQPPNECPVASLTTQQATQTYTIAITRGQRVMVFEKLISGGYQWFLPEVARAPDDHLAMAAGCLKEVVGISLADFPWRIASHTLRFDNRTLIVLQCPGACDLEAQIRRQMRQRPTALRQQVPEASLIGWEFLTEECGLRNDQFQQFQELIENHSHP